MRAKEDLNDDRYRQKVYDLTWQGKLWGRNGAIAWSRAWYERKKALGSKGDGAMALASTFYTASKNAAAKIKLVSFFAKPSWFVRALW